MAVSDQMLPAPAPLMAARVVPRCKGLLVRGWAGLWAESVRLGVRHLLRRGYRREAIVRVVVPLDPSRYLELPWALEQLGAKPGERVLDLAGPKLLSVVLARQGVRVTAVDQLEREIEAWRALAGDVPGLELRVADGRALPFEDASFDHACSISVLEHIEEPGDAEALRELARVVRPGGRVLVTLPHAPGVPRGLARRAGLRERAGQRARRSSSAGTTRRAWMRSSRPLRALELVSREVVRMSPNWNDAYVRSFPWLVPLGPLYGLLGREVAARRRRRRAPRLRQALRSR